jgi:chitodextrinase
LSPNTTYYFQIAGIDANGGQTQPSNTVTVTTSATGALAAPTSVQVFSATSTTATLTWTPSVNATTYRVFMTSTLNGAFNQTTNLANVTTSSATVTGLTPSTPYYFQVVAVDAAGNPSSPSATTNGITTP